MFGSIGGWSQHHVGHCETMRRSPGILRARLNNLDDDAQLALSERTSGFSSGFGFGGGAGAGAPGASGVGALLVAQSRQGQNARCAVLACSWQREAHTDASSPCCAHNGARHISSGSRFVQQECISALQPGCSHFSASPPAALATNSPGSHSPHGSSRLQ